MMAAMGFSDIIGRRVRLGDWQDQKISTYRKIHEALDEGRFDDASELAAYFVDEAKVCWVLYRQWILDLEGFLTDQGVDGGRARGGHRADRERDRAAERRAVRLGRPLGALQRADRPGRRGRRGVPTPPPRGRPMDEAKEIWRQTHDRDVDHTYGLMSAIVVRFGEAIVPRMYDRVLLPLFAWRYEKFDIDKHPWDEGLEALMYVACEAMRGHLVGPGAHGRHGARSRPRIATSSASTPAAPASAPSAATGSRARLPAWSLPTTGRSARRSTTGTTSRRAPASTARTASC